MIRTHWHAHAHAHSNFESEAEDEFTAGDKTNEIFLNQLKKNKSDAVDEKCKQKTNGYVHHYLHARRRKVSNSRHGQQKMNAETLLCGGE